MKKVFGTKNRIKAFRKSGSSSVCSRIKMAENIYLLKFDEKSLFKLRRHVVSVVRFSRYEQKPLQLNVNPNSFDWKIP